MKYKNIQKGKFLSRPNRFIANVELAGERHTVHVKNTGRCQELLVQDAEVYLEETDNPDRKTRYDLVAVRKGNRIVNMDSYAPNLAVKEWLEAGGLFDNVQHVRPETTYGGSRFDFYVETESEKIFIEVKGVTLENDNVVMFPDAPSERAVKHVRELMEAKAAGYETYILFVIQMTDVSYFCPNEETHAAFAQVLRQAEEAGVHIIAYDCNVWEEGMTIRNPVEVRLRHNPLQELIAPLLSWYDSSHRILPWRENPTPYRVWISEIMLQQTRVEAVKPYYERFLNALPDVHALAQVQEEELLKLWEGLGYYNRARNLKKAALQIEELYGGKMPECYEELLKLHGIGSYTAGAIASIAFGQAVPAVDGNVLRILARVLADDGDIMEQKVRKGVEANLLAIMPSKRPGDFNQALMELGATICTPNGAPKCERCPWEALCQAKARGEIDKYPKKTPKKARIIEKKTILIIQDENKTALTKRPEKGLLAGMYEFPSMEGHRSEMEVLKYLKTMGYQALHIQKLENAKHIFTHREWHMTGYAIRVDELQRPDCFGELIFAEKGETEEKYPIPSAFSAYAGYVNIRLGNQKYQQADKNKLK